jgi:MraZ protein
MRFLGNIEAKMDAKGRAFLPAVFRKILQTASSNGTAYADQSLRLVLRKDVFQPCLVLYPESVWNEQMDALRQRLNRWNKQHQQVFRQFVSEVEVLTLDGNGRFLVPKRYLRMADIEQDIKFVGMGDTIEIWSCQQAEKNQMNPEDFGETLEAIAAREAEERRLKREAERIKYYGVYAATASDVELLGALIWCESGNQPFEGMVAVGAVVMNRVMSSVFPDTVVGVIYQKNQFSPARSGRLAMALANNSATASCYAAADAAMAGQTNVGNCLFFRTPIEGLTGIRIDGHIFY